MHLLRRSLTALLGFAMLSSATAWAGSVSTAGIQPTAKWRKGPIRIAISQSLQQFEPNIKANSDVLGAIRRAAAAWQEVVAVDIEFSRSEKLNVSPAGLVGDGVSLITIAPTTENILLFKNDGDAAAKTRLFVDRRGAITEADIVLNPLQQFSTDGTYGTFDLETTLRHEFGHLLGLSHSPIVGSAMYDSVAKNGVFGDGQPAVGIITDDDRSAIRDLYDGFDAESCCGSVTGTITGAGKAFSADLWLEDIASGRSVAHTAANTDGSFRFGGIGYGTYRVVVRETSRNTIYATYSMGEVTVREDEPATISRRISRRPLDFSLLMLGRNTILSDSPIKLRPGASVQLYVGGRGVSAERQRVEIDSPYIKADLTNAADDTYEGGFSGMHFLFSVDDAAPAGIYNVCLSSNGRRDCLPGGIVVSDN